MRLRCIIHGNITSSPLTRCAALRGPRRAGRADFFGGFLPGFFPGFLTEFLTTFFFTTGLLVGFAFFFVAIIYLPKALRATAQLDHA